ncbi:MAG: Asp-tRNA(Asn)/Glu-tRNA(Gln) amidotransferase subunit GatC [Tissierellia bacterium]|nr:Asp-tRNA(Asn)/Glu-tRNA(Gln) amidotransferase subunit GatC [Tissierellia bacterium]
MDVERIYKKAFIDMKEEEREVLVKKFRDVVSSVDKIMEVDTAGIEIFEITSEIESPLRDDEVTSSLDREAALKNTVHREYGYFKLDKILED